MGYEPTTYCKICGQPFDVYRAPEERTCEACVEVMMQAMTDALCYGVGYTRTTIKDGVVTFEHVSPEDVALPVSPEEP